MTKRLKDAGIDEEKVEIKIDAGKRQYNSRVQDYKKADVEVKGKVNKFIRENNDYKNINVELDPIVDLLKKESADQPKCLASDIRKFEKPLTKEKCHEIEKAVIELICHVWGSGPVGKDDKVLDRLA